MKIRIGLITEDKDAQTEIKKEFPDLHIYQAPNVMDFYGKIGTNKIDAIVFSGGAKLVQEFTSYYNYLRQKPAFKNTPLAIVSSAAMVNKYPLPDTLVRSYSLANGYFIALIGFFNATQQSEALGKLLESERIEFGFAKALSNHVGRGQTYAASAATDEEAHSEFLVQHSDEIASNLSWFKFAARILTQGSDGLVKSISNLGEAEQQQFTSQLIASVFTEFTEEITKTLQDDGALFFNKTEALLPADKTPYIKKAKSKTVVFRSAFCAILVEFIRYI